MDLRIFWMHRHELPLYRSFDPLSNFHQFGCVAIGNLQPARGWVNQCVHHAAQSSSCVKVELRDWFLHGYHACFQEN